MPTPAALSLSYAGLMSVNTVYGAGMFGVPTNGAISGAYPTHVTPSGATFAIWGPIFLLQGGGTALMASGGDAARMATVATPWLATWAAEVGWQLVFGQLPVPADKGTRARKLLSLVPCSVLLGAAHGSMLYGTTRLASEAPVGALGACLVDFPSGLNAGWLAAATGIGATLVAQHVPALKAAATPKAGAILVGALTAYGAGATIALSASPAAAAGYAAATAWACRGIASEAAQTPEVVKATARRCQWVALAAGAVAIALSALKSR